MNLRFSRFGWFRNYSAVNAGIRVPSVPPTTVHSEPGSGKTRLLRPHLAPARDSGAGGRWQLLHSLLRVARPRPAQRPEREAADCTQRGSAPRAARRRQPATSEPAAHRAGRGFLGPRDDPTPPGPGHLQLSSHPSLRSRERRAPNGRAPASAPPRASPSGPPESPSSVSALESSPAGPCGPEPAAGGKRTGLRRHRASSAAPTRLRGKGEGEGEEGAGSLGGRSPPTPSCLR